MSNDFTLITNINFISLQSLNMRLDCGALVICPPDEDDGSSLRKTLPELRGFGTEASDPCFSMPVETMVYTIVDASDPTKIFMGEKTGMRPLFSGALLKIDRYEFFLQAEDYLKPMSIETFTRPSRKHFAKGSDEYYAAHSKFYDDLWNKLHERTAQFWHAPYYPTRKYMPVELVRISIAQEGVIEKMSRHDLVRAVRAIEVLRKGDDATLDELNSSILGMQSTDEPAIGGLHDELQTLKKQVIEKNAKAQKED